MQFLLIRRSFWLLAVVVYSGAALSADKGFVARRTEGLLTYYYGTVELKGNVERRTDPVWLELMGDLICFEATGSSKALIPRAPDDDRNAWFCFQNPKEAMKLLKLPKAPANGTCGYEVQATVRVTGYVLNRLESEVTDLAKLVSVVARGHLESIKCAQ